MPLLLSEESDAALARWITEQKGDSRMAEAELCRRFVPRVRAFGLRHLHAADAADELAQRVLMLVIEKLRQSEVYEAEAIASFILGTANHTAMAMRRGEKRTRPLEEVDEPWCEAPHTPVLDRERIAHCLEELAERERTVVTLTFFDDLSAGEIADTIGISAVNVRVMRHRALTSLRDCFERGAT
jgi:RNA polymerase sigma-70 factor (ECF subfamily)